MSAAQPSNLLQYRGDAIRINDSGSGAAMARLLARRHWLSGVWDNPLARPADRWQAGLRRFLIMLWAVIVPVAAVISVVVAADGLHTAGVQSRDRTEVTATVTTDAPRMTFTAGGLPMLGTAQVSARWFAPNGVEHTGDVPAQTGSRSGSTVRIWTDRAGTLVGPPIGVAAALGEGMLAGIGIIVMCGALLVLIFRLAVAALDRGRRAEWDSDWARVAPAWLGQQ